MPADDNLSGIEDLLETPDLAVALESDRFKQILDQVPVAIAVSAMRPAECVVYVNVEFQRLSGCTEAQIVGRPWSDLQGAGEAPGAARPLGRAVVEERDYLGSFSIPHEGRSLAVDAWSNVIEGDDGAPMFRLVALVETAGRAVSVLDQLQEQVREKDVQLKELQHRVKNNLQMITALIRMEAQGISDHTTGEGFDRLAGRVEALGLLYRALSDAGPEESVDLGVYMSEIASAVMRAHATKGIHLDLQVDSWLVPVDVAMPTGLVVNELLTNALKHAFTGGGGTISLHSTVGPKGCRVVVSDDGVGLPRGMEWPKAGKLSCLIVRSLVQNAHATIDVTSSPGKGMRVVIEFASAEVIADGLGRGA